MDDGERAPPLRKRKSRAYEPLHSAIARESRAMWYRLERTGAPAQPEDFPRVAALYYAAKQEWHRLPAPWKHKGFVYQGKRYRWAVTNLGRLKVLDAKTGCVLIQGGPFAV